MTLSADLMISALGEWAYEDTVLGELADSGGTAAAAGCAVPPPSTTDTSWEEWLSAESSDSDAYGGVGFGSNSPGSGNSDSHDESGSDWDVPGYYWDVSWQQEWTGGGGGDMASWQ
jgi:hypothetical protein